jgi:hypothetical protein
VVKVLGEVESIQTIAVGKSIREIRRLRKIYGGHRWRKLKGIATVELPNGRIQKAEVHWYEVHGIGKKELKIKEFLQTDL